MADKLGYLTLEKEGDDENAGSIDTTGLTAESEAAVLDPDIDIVRQLIERGSSFVLDLVGVQLSIRGYIGKARKNMTAEVYNVTFDPIVEDSRTLFPRPPYETSPFASLTVPVIRQRGGVHPLTVEGIIDAVQRVKAWRRQFEAETMTAREKAKAAEQP